MDIRRLARGAAQELTRRIGIRWGDTFPFYYVSEYPKSGGTWLAQMVADYLRLPFPQHTLLPLGFSCVIHNHWRFHPRLKRVFYLVRDGRDVMTSFYFHQMRAAHHGDGRTAESVRQAYERLFGKDYDPQDVVRHMPRFVEHEFSDPGWGTRLNWRDHIEDWRSNAHRDVVFLSYEDLRRDCAGTLGRAIGEITDRNIDPWQLETTVEKMSMKRQTGRDPGHGDATQHIRKGITGDWRNHFSREAAEVFDAFAGDTLVDLGYEVDRGWIDRYDLPSS